MTRRPYLGALAVAVVAVACSACVALPLPPGTPPIRVAVIGDSIPANTPQVDAETVISAAFAAYGVAGDWTADVPGTFAYETDVWQTLVPQALAGRPDVAVVSLGTNDLRLQAACDDPGSLDRFVALVPSTLPVLWVVPNDHAPLPPTCSQPSLDRFVAAIRALPARYPNVYLVDVQSGWWTTHRAYFAPDVPVHLSPAGAPVLAAVLLAGISAVAG